MSGVVFGLKVFFLPLRDTLSFYLKRLTSLSGKPTIRVMQGVDESVSVDF